MKVSKETGQTEHYFIHATFPKNSKKNPIFTSIYITAPDTLLVGLSEGIFIRAKYNH